MSAAPDLMQRIAELERERDEARNAAEAWQDAHNEAELRAESAERERDDVARHRDTLLNGFFASCPDSHEHGVWCGSAWVAVTARAEAAESALAAVRALADEWQATYDRWSANGQQATRTEIHRVHANRLRAALATPTTTEETQP